MKSLTITLCPTLYRHKLSDLNLCSLEGKNIDYGLYLLSTQDHENNEFSREMIFTDLADEV